MTVKRSSEEQMPGGVKISASITLDENGRPIVGWRMSWRRMRRFARRITRWWRPRMTNVSSDGWIVTSIERWSWRRWRWESDEEGEDRQGDEEANDR